MCGLRFIVRRDSTGSLSGSHAHNRFLSSGVQRFPSPPPERTINLPAYFSRIGYAGPREPSFAVLRDLQLAHVTSIPFENLDVLLKRDVCLEPEAVEQKLVTDRRGGYCFEQNSLFLRVLQSLGFSVTPLAARVRLGRSREEIPPRTHLFLRVDIAGTAWMADVGLGGLSLTSPIRLDVFEEQPTLHETRRLVPVGRGLIHQARMGGEWIDVTEFTGEEMFPIDRELANWWTSTSPNSKFAQNIMVGLARPDGSRFALNNTEFVHRRASDGALLANETITSSERLLDLLATRYGLRFPEQTKFGLFGL